MAGPHLDHRRGTYLRRGYPLCDRLLITRIDRDFEGDRFFPADWQKIFTKLVSSKKGEHQGLGYAFEIWER